MNLDNDGLPMTINPDGNVDRNDQLQRLGMIAAAEEIQGRSFPAMKRDALEAMIGLHAGQGVFTRYKGGSPLDVSADQLIAALAALVVNDEADLAWQMTKAMMQRWGFAQNVVDGLNGDFTTAKTPDFMLFRAMPLVCRIRPLMYPLALIFDFYLVLLAIGAVIYAKVSPDNVDQNNTILTFAVCSKKFVTPWAWLARKIIGKFLPPNLGRRIVPEKHPAISALFWYHRRPAGSPEIAEFWEPICKEYFE